METHLPGQLLWELVVIASKNIFHQSH